MLNRKRFWLFTGLLALSLVFGAATLSAVFAGPRTPFPLERPAAPDKAAARDQRAPLPAEPDEPRRPPGPDPRGAGGRGGDAGGAGVAPTGPVASPDSAAQEAPGPVAGPADAGGAGKPGADPDDGDPGDPADGPADKGKKKDGRTPQPPNAGGTPYPNCDKARRAGDVPLYRGEPGYSEKLDRDGDGIACDD
jgi:hypothetical protein